MRAADHVHALADAGAISTAIADRLDDNGFETIADLLIADQDDLTEVPYVGGQRADDILATVDAVMSPPEPRDVDLEATESVVSEAAIPMTVRQGEKVLVGGARSEVYHTRDCSVVRGQDMNLVDPEHVANKDLTECDACQDPGIYVQTGMRGRVESELEPLVDSREVILEASLGEKLNLTMAERNGYANPFAVIDTEEATEWETPTGDSWHTRRIRISQRPTVEDSPKECDLVLGADEIRLEDPPVKGEESYRRDPEWSVESVGAVGRVATSTYYQLVGQQQNHEDARPEGDDTWRKYQRGEA